MLDTSVTLVGGVKEEATLPSGFDALLSMAIQERVDDEELERDKLLRAILVHRRGFWNYHGRVFIGGTAFVQNKLLQVAGCLAIAGD